MAMGIYSRTNQCWNVLQFHYTKSETDDPQNALYPQMTGFLMTLFWGTLQWFCFVAPDVFSCEGFVYLVYDGAIAQLEWVVIFVWYLEQVQKDPVAVGGDDWIGLHVFNDDTSFRTY